MPYKDSLEHKRNDGKEHRNSFTINYGHWKDAIDNINFERYEILCMNCNWATRFGKICPHKRGEE